MVVLTGWLFASSCSPPRLSATQFLSATKGQLPLRSGLSPDCWSVLVGALEALVPRAPRQAVATTASTTDDTKDPRRDCGVWVFNLRPSLNLWIAWINLFLVAAWPR